MGLKPDLVFYPRLVASTTLDLLVSIIVLSLLLLNIFLVTLNVGHFFQTRLDFDIVFKCRFDSTRGAASDPVRADTPQASPTVVSEPEEY